MFVMAQYGISRKKLDGEIVVNHFVIGQWLANEAEIVFMLNMMIYLYRNVSKFSCAA